MAYQNFNIQMSDFPSHEANPDWEHDWSESEKLCPNCRTVKMWQTGWYDDSPEMGGGCIGTRYECGNCNHQESW